MRLGLDAMREACERWGHPEAAFAAVHIAGTNGKGSVAAMVESIARHDGLRTGLYTSPHLCRFAERVRLDGEPLDDALLADVLERVMAGAPDLSFFETATLASFVAFREAHVDLAVVEVGIGGRLDATNVLPSPRCAAITRIALDHVDRLGPTLKDIAREKAGIAKRGLHIVVGPVAPEIRMVIDQVAQSSGASTISIDETPVPPAIGLPGEHQKDNARVASAVGSILGASRRAIDEGIASVRWPGRLEQMGRYLLDAAHNPDGAASLARFIRSLSVPRERVTLVFGTLADKDWRGTLDELAPVSGSRVFVAPPSTARSTVDPKSLASAYGGRVADDIKSALATEGDLVVVAGSIALVGIARAELLSLPCDPPVAL
ncbi:MAG: folylpolyglutamate synthase/dihydrofolate synthase family protein [Polyangiaceae bacterium]|jgi:dihydrofolate synthase/folylpolyglutamate synthase